MKNKSNYLKGIILISIIIILVISIIIYRFDIFNSKSFVNGYSKFFKEIGRDIEVFISEQKNFAPIIFLIIFSLRTLFIVFPCSIMILLGGRVFGPTLGFTLSMIAIYISATLAFLIGRFFDNKVIERVLKIEFKALDSKVEKHGFGIIFFMRISMLFPFDILNLASGMSKIKYRDFILGTLLGVIPETVSLTYLGHNITNPLSIEFIISVILVLLTITISLTVRKLKKNKNSRI